MALELFPAERFHLAGNVSHDARVDVEERVAQILRRQQKAAILRRKTEQRDLRFAVRRQRADDRTKEACEERAKRKSCASPPDRDADDRGGISADDRGTSRRATLGQRIGAHGLWRP